MKDIDIFEENEKRSVDEGKLEFFPVQFDSDEGDDEAFFNSEEFGDFLDHEWAIESFKRMHKNMQS